MVAYSYYSYSYYSSYSLLLLPLLWSVSAVSVQDYWAEAGYSLLGEVPWRPVNNRYTQ